MILNMRLKRVFVHPLLLEVSLLLAFRVWTVAKRKGLR